ncbi:MAG: 2-amino-4-hydroxy-6-hydroxymethyldihydropteridine diphosphokinase [Bacteroidales bacterium]|nr:2-amino-4-hydroxy-6-hydroxymethyldihydropteridine diphosphokinase [Bacteroidales bacterium]
MRYRYYLNIGTNLGNREQNQQSAITALSEGAERVVVSDVVRSEPWGFASANEFLNVGIALDSPLEPHAMLEHIHKLEKELGSASHRDATGAYIDRLIDIDIMAIASDDGTEITISTPTLTVPHPHLNTRPFFLTPYHQLKEREKERKKE